MIPTHLEKAVQFKTFQVLDNSCLYVCLILADGINKAYVPVVETPHYMFARHILNGEPVKSVHGYRDYAHYVSVNPREDAEKCFVGLIASIKDNGYDVSKGLILVFRSWRRLFPLKRWDVADGFHRLAILAAMGESPIVVGTLQSKKSLWSRLVGRVEKIFNKNINTGQDE